MIQWTIVDLACAGYSMITATMYPTFDDEAITHIVKLCGIPVVFVQRANVARLFAVGPQLPSMRHVIVLDDAISGDDREKAGQLGWNIMNWEEFMSHGQARVPLCPPKDPKAMYSICFTSGTTGTPKGAILTHVGMTAVAAALTTIFPSNYYVPGVDIHVSYLPLAHIFERTAILVMMFCGTAIG